MGGGGASPPNVPTEEKKNHVHVTYTRERAPQKQIGLYIFPGFKIHLHAYTINAVPFYYLWYGAINDSIGQNTNIEKNLWIICERASLEIFRIFTFQNYYFLQYHHTVGISDTLSQKHNLFRSQMTSAYIYNQCSSLITYGMALYRQYSDKTLTYRKIYVYASERSERA